MFRLPDGDRSPPRPPPAPLLSRRRPLCVQDPVVGSRDLPLLPLGLAAAPALYGQSPDPRQGAPLSRLRLLR